MDRNFTDSWGGQIEGQLLRVTSGGKVPLADVDLNILEDVPGIRECHITAETKHIVVTTNAQGRFNSGTLKTGPYHICAEFDYEAGFDFDRRLTVIVATSVYVSGTGVTRITIKE